jgi:hypothetical protein
VVGDDGIYVGDAGESPSGRFTPRVRKFEQIEGLS